MASLWFFRDPGFIPGWSSLWGTEASYLTDATVAIACASVMFIIPLTTKDTNEKILNWGDAQRKFPWGVILLVGGGYALSMGSSESGFSQLMANELSALDSLPTFVLILVVTVVPGMITEFMSNTAIANIFSEIVAVLAVSLELNPYILQITGGCVD